MNWKTELAARKVLVADGGWGTEFAKLGLPPGEAPERWTLDRPSEVRGVAAAYVRAGVDIVLTNTFGGTRLKLEKSGLGARVAEINRRAVELSREAAGTQAMVFASIGPTGEFMAPLGALSEGEVIAAFKEQIASLALAAPDGLVLETFTDLGEIRAALRAAREVSALPVAACMTFDKAASGGYATIMGVTPEQAAESLTAAGADLVGTNCGAGIATMVEVVCRPRAAAGVPLWAKPNAGLPRLVAGHTVFDETPAAMAKRVPELIAAGARVVGGCCGTTPDHIAAIARAARRAAPHAG